MAIHSNILAWRIPWTEEPGGLQSMGLHRVSNDWSDWAHMHRWTWRASYYGSQTKINMYDITYLELKKYRKLVNITNKQKRQSYRQKEQTSGYQREVGRRRGNIRVGGKGYHGIIWNHVYETFENCEALQNLKNLSFSKKILKNKQTSVKEKLGSDQDVF